MYVHEHITSRFDLTTVSQRVKRNLQDNTLCANLYNINTTVMLIVPSNRDGCNCIIYTMINS